MKLPFKGINKQMSVAHAMPFFNKEIALLRLITTN